MLEDSTVFVGGLNFDTTREGVADWVRYDACKSVPLDETDVEFSIVFLTSSLIWLSSWQLILISFFISSTCTSSIWRSCQRYLLLHVEQHPQPFRAVQGLERHFAQVADVAYAAAFSVKGTGRPRGTDQKDSKSTQSRRYTETVMPRETLRHTETY